MSSAWGGGGGIQNARWLIVSWMYLPSAQKTRLAMWQLVNNCNEPASRAITKSHRVVGEANVYTDPMNRICGFIANQCSHVSCYHKHIGEIWLTDSMNLIWLFEYIDIFKLFFLVVNLSSSSWWIIEKSIQIPIVFFLHPDISNRINNTFKKTLLI